MQPLLEITLFSVAISLVLVLVTKFTTKPQEIRRIKAEMEELKKKAKEAQQQKNAEEAKRNSDLMLKKSQEQFRHSTKPMVLSLVIVMIAFSWIGTSFSSLSVPLSASETSFAGTIGYRDSKLPVNIDSHLEKIDIGGKGHKIGDVLEFGGSHWRIQKADMKAMELEMLPAISPFNIPFIGRYLTWFWLYIFITLPTTFIFRKLLGVE